MLVFLKYKKCIRRFARCPILLSKEVLLNFTCGMIVPLLKRIECYKRPLLTRLCHKKMFASGTEILKKAENMCVDNLQRFGWPSTSIDDQNINKIKEMVLWNRRLTIRELVDMVGISFGSVQTILKDHLGLRKRKRASRLSMWSNAFWLLAMNLGFMLTIQKQLSNQMNIF